MTKTLDEALPLRQHLRMTNYRDATNPSGERLDLTVATIHHPSKSIPHSYDRHPEWDEFQGILVHVSATGETTLVGTYDEGKTQEAVTHYMQEHGFADEWEMRP